MRKINLLQISILIFCLCVTGGLAYWKPETLVAQHDQPLEAMISSLTSWDKAAKLPLSPVIIDELKLDDYVFQTYTNGEDTVTLYVGYYFSGNKIGASHDPQVCYPGQGWQLSGKKQVVHQLQSGIDLHYSRIVAELEDKKEQIFYWFQIDDKSTSNTLKQKLVLFQKKILRRGEGNAFVRISTSLKDKKSEKAQQVLLNFIEAFYPHFLAYIKNG